MEIVKHHVAEENERTRYLIQVACASSEHAIAFPLARISTCGTLTIQILQAIRVRADGQREAVYGPPDPVLLAKKGASTAFTLLALLASQPGYAAKKDWLSEKLGHLSKEEDAEGEGLKRVDNVVSLLRFLLYPARAHESEEEHLLRRRLVAYQRASGESGSGYQLAGMPLVWLDVAEIEAHVKRARRLEQFGTDGLSEWQAAYDLAMGGRFLPGEAYSDWAEWRRQQMETSLWDCVQVLWHRSVEQSAVGEVEALRVLRDYWQSHVTSEDALRPLLELLGKREWYGQAKEYYEQLCMALDLEGKQPDQRTRDIMDFQQAMQIQRKPSTSTSSHLPERCIVEADGAPTSTFDASHLFSVPGGEKSESSFALQHIAPDWDSVRASEQLFANAERRFPASQGSFSHLWYVPHLRNPFFTGREELLAQLYNVLHTKEQTVAVTQHALYGLGGIGKTQVALEYAYRYRHEYQAIFWVKADTRESLLTDFLSFASLLQIPEQAAQDRAIVLTAVHQWFRLHEQWLLILDNADDLTLVREFLPTGHQGHILLTTRTQALGGLAYSLPVKEMSPDTGAAFLLRRAGLCSPDASLPEKASLHYQLARTLVLELGGLPLALDQAGAYIEETSSSLQDYLDLYRTHRLTLLQRRGGLTTDHPEPVATTWALTFVHIESSAPMAADILRFCAFLDPDGIPEEVLLAGILQLASAPTEIDHFEFSEAIGTLFRFSLVQRKRGMRTLTIHRLVQVMFQQTMEKEARHLWAVKAARAVYQALPQASTVYSSLGYPSRAVQRLTASIIFNREQENKEKLANELWNLAVQQQVIGKLSASEQNLQDCLTLCRDQHDSFNQAKAHQYFALLRTYQGDFLAASRHLNEAQLLFQNINAFAETGIVWAYRSLCALLLENAVPALEAAMQAWKQADDQKGDRDLIRAKWLLGWATIQSASQNSEQRDKLLKDADHHLQDALDRCRRIQMVDYEADLLLAWTRLYMAQGKSDTALTCANEALTIAYRADFRLLQADIHIVLAKILWPHNLQEAERHANTAIEAATCEGIPYCYAPALLQAKQVLVCIQTERQEKGRCG